MLQLKDISKNYITGNMKVEAIKKINISFRKNEFVSILGQSGGGKSTLLNIIGGLDKYTYGDLIINGKSTKDFCDRDWDYYRNNSIGFVFQSYNLIMHQTVLSNVELALTLSGIGKEERRERAKKALNDVGLLEQINKKPNELSGGQMQRVAIARALVNNPEILLADEPTGALDTDTSMQVMEILKFVAKDRLVIMVTHNSKLAEKYSTRIIGIKDGKIINDSNPFENNNEATDNLNKKRTSMNFLSALRLSFDNLLTKKGRTFITAFAGSIGIIGIALVLSLSSGVDEYISNTQEETMTSYPITINSESVDMSLFGKDFENNDDHDNDAIYTNNTDLEKKTRLTSSINKNNLASFKKYLEEDSSINDYVGKNGINYSYDLKYNIYSYDSNGELINTDGSTLDSKVPKSQEKNSQDEFMSLISYRLNNSNSNVFSEILSNSNDSEISDAVNNSSEVLYGRWPEKYNEVVLVLDENNEISSNVLYQLGLLPLKDYEEIMKNRESGENIDFRCSKLKYEDIYNKTLYLIPACDYYIKNGEIFTYAGADNVDKLLDKSIELKITGIVKTKSNDNSLISGNIGYTKALTNYLIDYTNNSEVVKMQSEKKNIDVLSGINFEKDNNTYDNNMERFGVIDKETPSSINIYVDNFENKNNIAKLIDDYNENASQEDKIVYTDFIAVLLSSVTDIISSITYVLIAFVSISLIVSSIMIGIITYVSVLERKKEIGILRAIGASKKDVSRIFNAETFIVGLVSGTMGVLITYLLCIPVNLVIHNVLKLDTVNIYLPLSSAIILIGISITLTIIAGLFPSKLAAKKDPVKALRSE